LSGLMSISSASFGAEGVKVSLCNENDEKIYLAVAYEPEANLPLMSRGWWGVEPQKCSELELAVATDRLLVYANSESGALAWSGGVLLCANTKDKFDFSGAATIACSAGNLKMLGFMELSMRRLIEESSGRVPKYSFGPSTAERQGDLLKICNDTADVVYISYAQGRENNAKLAVAGWFKINPSSCHSAVRDTGSKILYLYGDNQKGDKRWKGETALCTDSYNGFNFDDSSGMDCRGNNQKLQLFKAIGMSVSGDFEYRLKLSDSTQVRSMVQLCNQRSEKITVAIAYDNLDFPGKVVTSGWYDLEGGKCGNAMPIESDQLKVLVENSQGDLIRSGAFNACVDLAVAFEFGDATNMQCEGGDLRVASFDSISIARGEVKVNLP